MNVVRIVSSGLPNGTKVFLEDGSQLSGIRKIEWSVQAGDVAAEVKITIVAHNIGVEVEGIAEYVKG